MSESERQMKKFYLLFLFFLGLYVAGHAQSADTGIRGRVVDENQEPIGYATVVLYSIPDSAMSKAGYSEENGSFSFTHLKPGKYYLQLSFIGYDNWFSPPLDVSENNTLNTGLIAMSPFVTELGEIVVSSTKPVVEVKPDKTVFNIEGSVNAIGNDALELLRKAPGVVVDNNEQIMLVGKSGVRVYIDGKQSILTGEDLANYLKTIQSSQIESIEIITQPSSKYESEGNAGIINIRMIRDKSLGTNATISLNHAQALHGRSNVNLNVNNRTSKVATFGNVNFARGKSSNYTFFERVMPATYAKQDNRQISSWDNGSARVGVDLMTGSNSTAGILFDGFLNDFNSDGHIITDLAPEPNLPFTELLLGGNEFGRKRQNFNLNGNYRFDNRKGNIINLDLDYGRFAFDGDSYQPNFYYYPGDPMPYNSKIYSSLTATDITIRAVKADLERNIFGGKAGAGIKIGQVRTDNDFKFYDVIDGQDIENINRTNRFEYTENVNAAYVNFNRQWKKVGMQLGVRVELTDSKGVLTSKTPQNNEKVEQDYVDVFPSGGITYSFNPKNTVRLTYSRRIDRPNYQDLNPFEQQLDELTFSKGNPFLKPQYSNSFQLGYTYNYRLNFALSYTRTDDLMAQLVDTSGARGAFMTKENIAEQDMYAFNVSYPFAIGNSWNVFFNSGVNYSQNQADFGDGKTVNISATSFNFYAQNSFLMPGKFTLELSGFYNSPGIWGGNFTSIEMWAVEIGAQKKIFNNRGTIKLSVSDIFKTMEWGGESTFGALYTKAGGGWESRQAKINFTYLMGNTQVKSARKRSTGLEAESKRIEKEE